MSPNFNIKEIILWIKSELKDYYPQTEIDSFVSLILKHLLNYSRTKLILNHEQVLSSNTIEKIDQIVSELKLNKPIQYILGQTEFFNLNFHIASGVLIPRPETEELVDWIISENKNGFYRILDIGTGSGVIAIALSKNMPGSNVTATDISNDALIITRENCKLNNVEIQLINHNILNHNENLNNTFDIIVSNPPYITEKEKELMHPNVLDYEPTLALFVSDDDPLLFYRHIIEFALVHLNSGGKIYFEINELFGNEVALLLEEKNFSEIILKKDINNKDRMIKALLK